jgi:hypothetical protein
MAFTKDDDRRFDSPAATRERDLGLLKDLLGDDVESAHDGLTHDELAAFLDMRAALVRLTTLTKKQRVWVTGVHTRLVETYTADATKVFRGKEVKSMVGALPLRPPPMPQRNPRPYTPPRLGVPTAFRARGLAKAPDDPTRGEDDDE